MFITKVEIENFKCFKEKAAFDLEPNENQIILDIDKGYFVRKQPEDLIFSPIAAIGGANAKGKTTLLESIAFFSGYFNEEFVVIKKIIFILFEKCNFFTLLR